MDEEQIDTILKRIEIILCTTFREEKQILQKAISDIKSNYSPVPGLIRSGNRDTFSRIHDIIDTASKELSSNITKRRATKSVKFSGGFTKNELKVILEAVYKQIQVSKYGFLEQIPFSPENALMQIGATVDDAFRSVGITFNDSPDRKANEEIKRTKPYKNEYVQKKESNQILSDDAQTDSPVVLKGKARGRNFTDFLSRITSMCTPPQRKHLLNNNLNSTQISTKCEHHPTEATSQPKQDKNESLLDEAIKETTQSPAQTALNKTKREIPVDQTGSKDKNILSSEVPCSLQHDNSLPAKSVSPNLQNNRCVDENKHNAELSTECKTDVDSELLEATSEISIHPIEILQEFYPEPAQYAQELIEPLTTAPVCSSEDTVCVIDSIEDTIEFVLRFIKTYTKEGKAAIPEFLELASYKKHLENEMCMQAKQTVHVAPPLETIHIRKKIIHHGPYPVELNGSGHSSKTIGIPKDSSSSEDCHENELKQRSIHHIENKFHLVESQSKTNVESEKLRNELDKKEPFSECSEAVNQTTSNSKLEEHKHVHEDNELRLQGSEEHNNHSDLTTEPEEYRHIQNNESPFICSVENQSKRNNEPEGPKIVQVFSEADYELKTKVDKYIQDNTESPVQCSEVECRPDFQRCEQQLQDIVNPFLGCSEVELQPNISYSEPEEHRQKNVLEISTQSSFGTRKKYIEPSNESLYSDTVKELEVMVACLVKNLEDSLKTCLSKIEQTLKCINMYIEGLVTHSTVTAHHTVNLSLDLTLDALESTLKQLENTIVSFMRLHDCYEKYEPLYIQAIKNAIKVIIGQTRESIEVHLKKVGIVENPHYFQQVSDVMSETTKTLIQQAYEESEKKINTTVSLITGNLNKVMGGITAALKCGKISIQEAGKRLKSAIVYTIFYIKIILIEVAVIIETAMEKVEGMVLSSLRALVASIEYAFFEMEDKTENVMKRVITTLYFHSGND